MDTIMKCREDMIWKVVEDAAQGVDACYKEKPCTIEILLLQLP